MVQLSRYPLHKITMPSLFENLPADVYHQHEAISSTQLVAAVEKSLAHFWRGANFNPDAEKKSRSEAMVLGSAVHCYLLEPDTFARKYIVLPEDAPRRPNKAQRAAAKPSPATLEAIAWWDAMEARTAAGEVELVTPDELALFQAMGEALRQQKIDFGNGVALPLLDFFKQGMPEESFFWIDEGSGLPLRARTDWRIHIPGLRLIIDYKTARSAQKNSFNRQAGELYYWMRAAMYIDGVKAVTGEAYDYILLAQEKEPPYLAAAFTYASHQIDLGRELYRSTLAKVQECRASGEWPGYGDRLQTLEIPQYMFYRHPELADIASGQAAPQYQ